MSCQSETVCIDLTGKILNITIPNNAPSQITIKFPYSIVGYSFVAKILDNSFTEVVVFDITLDEANNKIVLSLTAEDTALLVGSPRYTWYLKQTSSTAVEGILIKGSIVTKQITEIV